MSEENVKTEDANHNSRHGQPVSVRQPCAELLPRDGFRYLKNFYKLILCNYAIVVGVDCFKNLGLHGPAF